MTITLSHLSIYNLLWMVMVNGHSLINLDTLDTIQSIAEMILIHPGLGNIFKCCRPLPHLLPKYFCCHNLQFVCVLRIIALIMVINSNYFWNCLWLYFVCGRCDNSSQIYVSLFKLLYLGFLSKAKCTLNDSRSHCWQSKNISTLLQSSGCRFQIT